MQKKSAYIFALGVWILGITAAAEQVDLVEFFLDEKEQKISIDDDACQAYLDDESNFAIQKKSGAIVVTVLGFTDRSASLLIDCAKGSHYYSLKFLNRRKYTSNDLLPQYVRPESYVGISFGRTVEGVRSGSLEAADRSNKLTQISARQTLQNVVDPSLGARSVDLAHEMEEWRLAYGYTDSRSGLQSSETLRLGASLFGLSASHSATRFKEQGDKESISWLRTPNPLGLGVGYQRNRDGGERRIVERFFSGSLGLVSVSAQTRYSDEISKNNEKSRKGDLNVSELFLISPMFRPSNSNTLECSDFQVCKISEWKIGTDISYTNFTAALEYGILPHAVGFTLTKKFDRRHNLTMQYRQGFDKKSSINNERWVFADDSPAYRSDASSLHLEFEEGNWVYFVEETFGFLDKAKPNSSAGLRYEGARLTGSASIESADISAKKFSYLFEMHYFFDNNLKKLAASLATTNVHVNVVSNATELPLAGANVTLTRDGVILSNKNASDSGEVTFTEAKCCGEFQLLASFANQVSTKNITLSTDNLSPDVKVVINNRRPIRVVFMLATDANSKTEVINVANYFPEVDGAIIGHPLAVYDRQIIWIPKNETVDLTSNDQLLPFQYKIERIEGSHIDGSNEDGHEVTVFLREKK